MARTQIAHIVSEVDGDSVPSAVVYVLHRATGIPASVTVNENGTGGNINPATTDSAGRIPGWVEEGSYTLVVSASSFATYSRAYEALYGANVANVGVGAATTTKILDNVLTTAHFVDNTVITVNIGDGQVTEPKLADNSISTRVLAAKSVAADELATNSIDQDKMQIDSVGQAQVAAAAVTSAELANNAVSVSKIAPASAATADFADQAVTSVKMFPEAVTEDKIANGAVDFAALSNTFFPIGGVIAMPSFQPLNANYWNYLDGSAISRTTYAALFALIGTTFGVGDGSSTFNLPDTRGRFIWGLGTKAGMAIGNTEGYSSANLGKRSARHYHGLGFLGTVTNTGNHSHNYYRASVGGYGMTESWDADGPYNMLLPEYQGLTTSVGHTHSNLSGYAGWSGQQINTSAYKTTYWWMRTR